MKSPIFLILLALAIPAAWAADKPKPKATAKVQEAPQPPQVQPASIPPPPPTEKLVASAVICDSQDDLKILEMGNLKGQPGTEIFKRVKGGIEFNEQYLKSSNLMKQVALSRQMDSLKSDIAAAEAENKVMKNFVSNCILTADAEEEVSILEMKIISGFIKVRATVKGAIAEVWTKTEFLVSRKPQS